MNRLHRTFVFVCAIAFLVTVYDLLLGGFRFEIHGLRISSWEAYRPFMIAVLSGTIVVWLEDRHHPLLTSWDRLDRRTTALAILSTFMLLGVSVRYGAFVAGGADQYGYVSEAVLWTRGNLIVPEPLFRVVPTMPWSVSPLGYRPAQVPDAIVPTYAPGLPLTMAAAMKVGGVHAAFFVVPLLGSLAIWLTFVLGRRLSGPRTGLIAAVMLACSPIFLVQLFQPMSDVPVTAWWLLSIVLALSPSRTGVLLAGCAASAAVLTRPNLVVLALVVCMLAARHRPRITRMAWFTAGVVPGCLVVAAVNIWLYGSPLTSGYGPLGTIFGWGRVAANLARYPKWMVQLESIAIVLAFAAPFVRRRRGEVGADHGVDDRVFAWLLLAFTGVVLLSYLFYIPFDHWSLLRFLLPSVPLLLVLASAVTVALIGRLQPTSRGAIALLVFGSTVAWYTYTTGRIGAFQQHISEQRYVVSGAYIETATPPNAIAFAMQESGSVRFYGHRPTLRWDVLSSSELERAVQTVEAAGYDPYIVLELWEEPKFKARFPSSTIGALDWPPVAECLGGAGVRIYRIRDRERFFAGEAIVTRQIQVN